jgi:type VI secretion system secreted protein Hcp
MAAVDYFLKIEGIKGESHNAKHKDEIDVRSFSWGVSQTRARAGGGGGAGKVQFQDFHFANLVSKASPSLFLKCASGEHIKQAVFVGEAVNPKGEVSGPFLKYTFTDVLISSYSEAGAETVQDAASIAFASVKTETTPGAGAGIIPTAIGSFMIDAATGQFVPVPGDLLTSGPVFNVDGILIGLSRGLVEFDLSDVLGLISGPQPHLRLVLTVREVRPIQQLTDQVPLTVNNLDTAVASTEPPNKKSLRHDLSWYGPTDLELTAEDYGRPAHRFGQIQVDPGGDPVEQQFDLTRIVRRHDLDSVGIRIQAALDRAHDDTDDENGDDQEDRDDKAQHDGDDASKNQDSPGSKNDDQGNEDGRPASIPVSALFSVELELVVTR